MRETPTDHQTYEIAKHYLKTALEHMLASGRSVRDLIEFPLEKFGDDSLPSLVQFLHNIKLQHINISGMTTYARAAIFGQQVTPEERGFSGDSSEQDWIEAERQVNEKLAGVLVKGSKLVATVAATLDTELAETRQEISDWLDKKAGAIHKMLAAG